MFNGVATGPRSPLLLGVATGPRSPLLLGVATGPRSPLTGPQMTYNDLMSTACSTIASAMGESVAHTDADGVETAIAGATFAEANAQTAEARDGQETIRRATCTIPQADVAAPAIADGVTRTLDSSQWAVETEPMSVGGGDYWQLALMQSDSLEKTREGMRLPRR